MSKSRKTNAHQKTNSLPNFAETQQNRQFVTKGNRLIPVVPGFIVIPGSEKEGSPLLIKDPVTNSLYRWVLPKVAVEIINKELDVLAKSGDDKEKLEQATAASKELKREILAARAVFQKVGSGTGVHSTTFRLAY